MTVEYDAVYVEDLDPDLPADNDDISEGNDHIMLIKQVLQNTFPSATQALEADFEYLNEIPTRIVIGNDTESDEDSSNVLAMDMQGNRLKNIHDANYDQDVPSLAQVKSLITDAFSNGIYGVGQLYVSRSSTSPADVLGFGTWVQVAGGIFGAGTFASADGENSYDYQAGFTYGAPDIILNASQLPEQTIDFGATDADGNPYVTTAVTTMDASNITMTAGHYSASEGGSGHLWGEIGIDGYDYTAAAEFQGDLSHNHAMVGTATSVVNVMSPINVFYIWERTA
jgi:hypothetical protein